MNITPLKYHKPGLEHRAEEKLSIALETDEATPNKKASVSPMVSDTAPSNPVHYESKSPRFPKVSTTIRTLLCQLSPSWSFHSFIAFKDTKFPPQTITRADFSSPSFPCSCHTLKSLSYTHARAAPQAGSTNIR